MTDSGGPPDSGHYPDVAAVGDLCTALQAIFDSTGITLRALHVAAPGWLRVSSEVRAGDRHANVLMAQDERLFLLDCWLQGVHMAKGGADDLTAVGAAISMFLSGSRVRQLTAAWPFIGTWEAAEAYEESEAAAIAYRWRRYLAPPSARASHLQHLHAFLLEAGNQPRLRALYPFTSHGDLGLRRSVPDLTSQALVWVRPFGAGQYVVADAERGKLYWRGPICQDLWGDPPAPGALGPADAHETVALALTVLDRQHPPHS